MIFGIATFGTRLGSMKQKLAQMMQWDAARCTDAPARRDVCLRQDVLRLDVVALAGTTPQTYGLAMVDGQPRRVLSLGGPSVRDEAVAPEPPDGNGGRGLPAAPVGPHPMFAPVSPRHDIGKQRRAA